MIHTPTILDVKTDIIRAIYSTYSPDGLENKNFKFFLKNALTNLEKIDVGERKKKLVNNQIEKSKVVGKGINRVREDLLLINSFL